MGDEMNFSNYFKKGVSWANNKNNAGTVSGISGAISTVGTGATAAIESGNNANNLKWGSQGDVSRSVNEGIVSVAGSINPAVGLIASGANSIGKSIGAAANKMNNYDEYGFNSEVAKGGAYYRAGHVFDPVGQALETLKSGYEGSGLDAGLTMLGLGWIGGQRRFNAEQKIAQERRRTAEMEEESAWALNQFNFTPNLNV